jgi:hypothetical protein
MLSSDMSWLVAGVAGTANEANDVVMQQLEGSVLGIDHVA